MTHRVSGLLAIGAIVALGFWSAPAPVVAQDYSGYCHDRAQRLSGYRGRPGGAVEGAVRGAVGGALLSGILGGNKKDRRKAAKIGALLGGISNANRSNSRAARIYRLEYQDCMRRR